jgi:hypothetical protein
VAIRHFLEIVVAANDETRALCVAAFAGDLEWRTAEGIRLANWHVLLQYQELDNINMAVFACRVQHILKILAFAGIVPGFTGDELETFAREFAHWPQRSRLVNIPIAASVSKCAVFPHRESTEMIVW